MAKPYTDLVKQLRQKKQNVSRMLREAEKLTGGQDLRARDAARKRDERAASNDLTERMDKAVAAINWQRREQCLGDVFRFLRTYMAAKFSNPFTEPQKQIVRDILRCARDGSDQAIAAPRGDGKTAIAEGVIAFGICSGTLKFPLIVGANAEAAEQIVKNIQEEFEDNDLLAHDFPDVCLPIRELEGANQRARTQTVYGERTRLQWTGGRIVFPTIKAGDKRLGLANGAILMSRGMDAAIRGIRKGSVRPDFVLIDDPETRESAESETQTEKRKRILEQDIGGLGGPGVKMGRLMLCTIMNRRCLAFEYTDPKQKPSWNGVRHQLLPSPPEREDLWEQYVALRMTEGPDAATDFYREHCGEMDAGAVVSNPYRRKPHELSAVQHVYNLIADRGLTTFLTEYQNDPPEEEEPEDSGITAGVIMQRCNGEAQQVVPASCTVLTCGMDLGKFAGHWVVTAWDADARGYVVDYGVLEIHNEKSQDEEAVELAIKNALHRWREEMLAEPYRDEDGVERPLDVVLIDAGYRPEAVYGFVREVGGKPFRAAMGQGDGERGGYRQPKEDRVDIRTGDHWWAHHLAKSRVWLHNLHADYWKHWLHDRLMTPIDRPGSLTLFGRSDEARQHMSFAHHLTAEVWRTEFKPGRRGQVSYWHKTSRNNHWLDASYMACAAAAMCGVKLVVTDRPIARAGDAMAVKPRVMSPARKISAGPRPPILRQNRPWVNSWQGRH